MEIDKRSNLEHHVTEAVTLAIDKVSNYTRLIAWTKCLHAYSAKYL